MAALPAPRDGAAAGFANGLSLPRSSHGVKQILAAPGAEPNKGWVQAEQQGCLQPGQLSWQ